MSRARGGEILISQMVRGVIGASGEFSLEERGRFTLKGFDTRWRLYRVAWREERKALTRRQLAILVTDLKGSTEAADRLGDDAAFSLLRAHSALMQGQATAHGAGYVKSAGDAFLLGFDDPGSAIACASAIQRSFGEARRAGAGAELHVSVVVHSGWFIVEAGELFSRELFLAFRLLDEASADEVLVTEAVRERLGDGVALRERRTFELRGIGDPQSAYEMVWTTDGVKAAAVAV
jgi:class 3 adenylate cyclase